MFGILYYLDIVEPLEVSWLYPSSVSVLFGVFFLAQQASCGALVAFNGIQHRSHILVLSRYPAYHAACMSRRSPSNERSSAMPSSTIAASITNSYPETILHTCSQA
jgi:hypothetical protein